MSLISYSKIVVFNQHDTPTTGENLNYSTAHIFHTGIEFGEYISHVNKFPFSKKLIYFTL